MPGVADRLMNCSVQVQLHIKVNRLAYLPTFPNRFKRGYREWGEVGLIMEEELVSKVRFFYIAYRVYLGLDGC